MYRHLVLFVSLLAACSKTAADPPATGSAAVAVRARTRPVNVAPPSTGREMPAKAPALDRAALAASVQRGVEAAAKARDPAACGDAVAAIYPAAAQLGLQLDDKTRPVFAALAHCARMSRRYRTLEWVARTAPGAAAENDLAIALIGQERYAEAGTELEHRLAAAPHSPLLLATAARLECKLHAFAKCRKAAELALTAAAKSHDPDAGAAVALANVSVWQAAAMLGDYARARRAVAAFPDPSARDTMTRLLVSAEHARLAVDVESVAIVPLGSYHLAGTVDAPVVSLTLGNGSSRPRDLKVQAQIDGVTEPMIKHVVVLAHQVVVVPLTPVLASTFSVTSLAAPRQAQLELSILDGKQTVFEDSRALELLPRDYLPTWEKIGADTLRPAIHNVAAWVTPNDPAIDRLLAAAKQRLGAREAFSGPQSATLPQVRAIYDELQARGMSYVMDPDIGSDGFVGQRTRLPAEVLASTNAQCLEGTLLFASALEALGLDAIIVTVPGHAFVGWHASPKDGQVPAKLFVETTMVHAAPFDAAVKVAMKRVADETAAGNFESGMSRMLELPELRARGITPQPAVTP